MTIAPTWFSSGPGTVASSSAAAVTITGNGAAATSARRIFDTVPGTTYKVSWTSDTATGAYSIGKSHRRWNPPVMASNVITVDLNTESATKTVWTFDPDQDVIFLPKNGIYTNERFQTNGGRNIWIKGGHFRPLSSNSAASALNFTNNIGGVWMDGVYVDMSGVGQRDAVNYFSPPTTKTGSISVLREAGTPAGSFYAQNCRFANIQGRADEALGYIHGDVFQPQGDVGDIGFYNCWMSTQYQSLLLEQRLNRGDGDNIGRADLEKMTVKRLTGGDATSKIFYFCETTTPQFPCTLKDVWGEVVETATIKAETHYMWPPFESAVGARRNGNQVSWSRITGYITVGVGPDYAPASTVGLNYDPNNAALEPVIQAPLSFVAWTNSLTFKAVSDKTYIQFQRTAAGTATLTGLAVAETTVVVAKTIETLKANMPFDVEGGVSVQDLHDIVDTLAERTTQEVLTQTGSYAAAVEDNNRFVVMNASTANTFTIPSNVPVGWECTVSGGHGADYDCRGRWRTAASVRAHESAQTLRHDLSQGLRKLRLRATSCFDRGYCLMLARTAVSAERRSVVVVSPTVVDVTTFSTKAGDGTTSVDSGAKTLTVAFGTASTSLRGQHPVNTGARYRVSWSMSSTNATQGQMGAGTSIGGPQYRPTLSGVAGTNFFDFTAVSTPVYLTAQRASTGETTFSDITVTEIPEVAWTDLSPQPIKASFWTAVTTGVSVNGTTGDLTIAATGTLLSAAGALPTTVGKLYRLVWTVGTNTVQCAIGSAQGSSVLKSTGVNHAIGVNSYEFTAAATTTWIQFQRQTTGTATVSSIALQEIAGSTPVNVFTSEFTTEFMEQVGKGSYTGEFTFEFL